MKRLNPGAALLALVLLTVCPATGTGQMFPEEPPYVPTEMELVEAMLRLGDVGRDDLLFDLGSGDGRIVLEAARRYGTRGIGYEHQEPLVALSRARADSLGVSSLTRFVADDLFQADLSGATVVMVYLGAAFNLRLRPILLSRLAPGTRVVSNTFHMGDWSPDSTVHLGHGPERATLHRWVIPARVDGFWTLAIEGDRTGFAIELDQRFQVARGRARAGNRSFPIEAARLDGERITFSADLPGSGGPLRFDGRVRGGRMEGTVTDGRGETRRWIALRFTHPALAPRG
jgi:hypothetical protein